MNNGMRTKGQDYSTEGLNNLTASKEALPLARVQGAKEFAMTWMEAITQVLDNPLSERNGIGFEFIDGSEINLTGSYNVDELPGYVIYDSYTTSANSEPGSYADILATMFDNNQLGDTPKEVDATLDELHYNIELEIPNPEEGLAEYQEEQGQLNLLETASKKTATISVSKGENDTDYTVVDTENNTQYIVTQDGQPGELGIDYDTPLSSDSAELYEDTLALDNIPFDTLPEAVQEYINGQSKTSSKKTATMINYISSDKSVEPGYESGTVPFQSWEEDMYTISDWVAQGDFIELDNGTESQDLDEIKKYLETTASKKTAMDEDEEWYEDEIILDDSRITWFQKPTLSLSGMATFYILLNGDYIPNDQGNKKVTTDNIASLISNYLVDFTNAHLEITDNSIDIIDESLTLTDLDGQGDLKIASKKTASDEEELTAENITSLPYIIQKKHPEYGAFKVMNKYDEGIYEIRGQAGGMILTDNEYHFWTITDPYKTASNKKTATYFDGYAYRVTIESSAADNNGTYSFITNMLSAADIRYQEVRRYTIEPDRVLLDILINEEDVDVIKGLDKEGKEYNVSFTFNNNVSEGLQPKTIVTPEKEVEEKV